MAWHLSGLSWAEWLDLPWGARWDMQVCLDELIKSSNDTGAARPKDFK